MVDEFKKNTTNKTVETRENAFLNVDVIEILREATEDADTDTRVFDTDDEQSSSDENYDTDLSEDDDDIDELSE